MKKTLISLLLLLSSFNIFSQTVKLTYNGSGNYTLRERTDLRQYTNGKYIGLVSREVTSYITPVYSKSGYEYEGSFFVQQDTHHAREEIGFGIRESIPSAFRIEQDGSFKMLEDHGYPSFRSFPSFTDKKIKIGDVWQAKAERAVDPLNKGIVTKMPIYVQYKYVGDEYFGDEPVYLLTAQWATRYGMGSGTSYIDWCGDKELEKAIGSHKATIYVSKITGNSLVVRDSVDETYTFADGNVVQFKGTISLFTEYPPSVNRDKLIPVLKRVCELTDEESESLKTDKPVTEALSASQTVAMAEKVDGSLPELTAASNLQDEQIYLDELEAEDKASKLTKEQEELILKKQQQQQRIAALTEKVQKFEENNKSAAKNKTKIAVDETPAGIRLSIQDLQFKANSSELLPGESSRLDQIAEILKTVDTQLLVEGHTASTGNPKGEQQLSIERAQSIAAALTKRGVSSQRFICKGFGGTKPVADNSTAEGKARNRRVEITILN